MAAWNHPARLVSFPLDFNPDKQRTKQEQERRACCATLPFHVLRSFNYGWPTVRSSFSCCCRDSKQQQFAGIHSVGSLERYAMQRTGGNLRHDWAAGSRSPRFYRTWKSKLLCHISPSCRCLESANDLLRELNYFNISRSRRSDNFYGRGDSDIFLSWTKSWTISIPRRFLTVKTTLIFARRIEVVMRAIFSD